MTHLEQKLYKLCAECSAAVCQHFKIAKATLWHWAKNRPNFPAPIKAGARVTLFDINQISAFITAQNQIQK